MKNLAKLQLQIQQEKTGTKPMVRARTARQVPQMRKIAKVLTGRKEGGTMTKDKDRLSQKDIKKAEELVKGFGPAPDSESEKKGRDKAKKVKKKFRSIAEQARGFLKEMIGKNRGGVIRPRPTYKGKVLKPKPIKSRGVGIAIRGFGKAFKKGR